MESITGETPAIPVLQPGEKVIGSAYLTEDGEIVFTSHRNSIEVALVEPKKGSSGPWAVRLKPPAQIHLTRTAGA